MSTKPTITEFLEARIAEDEVDAARDLADMERSAVSVQYDCDTQARFTPARVLAECAAKRAIIGIFPIKQGEPGPLGTRALETLALIYKDHPDYQQEWVL